MPTATAPAPLTMATISGTRPTATDLRTPRSTFDTFCRAILAGQPATLWAAIHPDLRFMMQRRYYREGDELFFSRMRSVVSSAQGRLCLGEPQQVESHSVACPVLRAGRRVATAWFQFTDRSWLLTSLA